jgi:hypothetical protein
VVIPVNKYLSIDFKFIKRSEVFSQVSNLYKNKLDLYIFIIKINKKRVCNKWLNLEKNTNFKRINL